MAKKKAPAKPAPKPTYAAGSIMNDPAYQALIAKKQKELAKAKKDEKKSAKKSKEKKQLTPQEKIRAQYEEEYERLSDLGKKGKLSVEEIQGAPLDMSGINELKAMALTPSKDSVWLKLAQEQQALDEANQLSNAAKQAATQGAMARTNLAMQGGLRSGAAERLAQAEAEQGLNAAQNVRGGGAMARIELARQAEANRMNALGQLPGAQMGAAQYGTGIEQFNAQNINQGRQFNAAANIRDMDQWNQMRGNIYKEDMADWAAQQQAAAIADRYKTKDRSMFQRMADPLNISPTFGSSMGNVGGGGPQKIICTEYCRQGWISEEVLKGDLEYADKYLSKETRANYLMWAQYVVPLMQRFPILLYLFWPLTYNWVHYMAWKMGRYHTKPLFGPAVEKICTPISNALGRKLRRMKRRRLYAVS